MDCLKCNDYTPTKEATMKHLETIFKEFIITEEEKAAVKTHLLATYCLEEITINDLYELVDNALFELKAA